MHKYSMNVVRQEGEKQDAIQSLLKTIHFVLDGCGHQMGNCPNNTCDNRINADFEIIYVIGGANEIRIEGKLHRGKAGDLFLIPPFVGHSIDTARENPHNNYWLHFDIDPYFERGRFISSITSGSENYRVHIGVNDRLIALFEELNGELCAAKPGYKVMSQMLLTQIITLLIRENMGRKGGAVCESPSNSIKERIVRDAMGYIEENLAKNLSVGEIAGFLHISSSYLYKCFDDVVNTTPKTLFQMLRAKQAKILIETSDMRLSEVAARLGFSSYYYFSAFFKKMYGLSPRDYRSNAYSMKNNL